MFVSHSWITFIYCWLKGCPTLAACIVCNQRASSFRERVLRCFLICVLPNDILNNVKVFPYLITSLVYQNISLLKKINSCSPTDMSNTSNTNGKEKLTWWSLPKDASSGWTYLSERNRVEAVTTRMWLHITVLLWSVVQTSNAMQTKSRFSPPLNCDMQPFPHWFISFKDFIVILPNANISSLIFSPQSVLFPSFPCFHSAPLEQICWKLNASHTSHAIFQEPENIFFFFWETTDKRE